jgi:hypothetical protein
MNKITQLPPSAFTWEKYFIKVGFTISEIFADPWKHPTKLCPEVTVVGFCPANTIRIRQRPTGFVVMLEREGEDFWLHMDTLPE